MLGNGFENNGLNASSNKSRDSNSNFIKRIQLEIFVGIK